MANKIDLGCTSPDAGETDEGERSGERGEDKVKARWAKSACIVGCRDFIAPLYCDPLSFSRFFFLFCATLISVSSPHAPRSSLSLTSDLWLRDRESDFYEAARLASPEMQPVCRHP